MENQESPLFKDWNASDDYIYSQFQKVVEALVIQIESIAEQMVEDCIDLSLDRKKRYLKAIVDEGKVDLRKTVETGCMKYRD